MYVELRAKTYRLFAPYLGGRIGYVTDWLIMLLIAANVAAVIFQTTAYYRETYQPYFHGFELFSITVFTVEYLGRVWSIVEDPEYNGIITGRLEYAARPLLVVDLLAILPFYLATSGVAADLRYVRALRLVRLLRLLKLTRYTESINMFSEVLSKKKADLVIVAFINLTLLTVTSSAMYFVENEAQPETFSSIPDAMWWGVVTFTTVGYGGVVPTTTLGRLLGAFAAVLGVGLFALPASILASGFIQSDDEPVECPHCGEDIEVEDL
jgi:voltage-gated potassium channel